MKCSDCVRGFHNDCWGECSCDHQATPTTVTGGGNDENRGSQEEENWRQALRKNRGRRTKRDASLKDQQSTGRKRAARLYPLDSSAACEWRGKANCGGGEFPVLGCIEGRQTDRHHGPDKVVTNNEPGNVHRICSSCHHEWHAKNNKDYEWKGKAHQLHQPRPMTTEELWEAAQRDLLRRDRKIKRMKD